MHGASAPQVRESARRRLLAAADFAIDYLVSLLEPRPPCQHCGRSDADRDPTVVRAAQIVLDRAGFHPTLQVQLQPPDEDIAHMTLDQLATRAEEIAKNARALADEENQRLLPPALDAEVIEDEPAADVPIPPEIGTIAKRTDAEEPASD
jgi:hypothetical protein